MVYRVSVAERPSASETPLPVPCYILLFFGDLIDLFHAVVSISELHSCLQSVPGFKYKEVKRDLVCNSICPVSRRSLVRIPVARLDICPTRLGMSSFPEYETRGLKNPILLYQIAFSFMKSNS